MPALPLPLFPALPGRAVAAVACLLLTVVLAGCRFGGPRPAAGEGEAGALPVPVDAPADQPPSAEASVAVDRFEDGGDRRETEQAGVDAHVSADAGGGCQPPFTSAVCDPVCNTGCPALRRCDVSDHPRTGVCVGIFVVGEGGLCFRGEGTDSCAPRLTCLDGRCQRLCYRDADCTTPGTCCRLVLEAGGVPSGFRGCLPCAADGSGSGGAAPMSPVP